MKNLLLTSLLLCGLSYAGAQPKPDTAKTLCTVELPQTVTSQTLFTIKSSCKLASFKLEVYSRWGQVMLKTEDPDEYEIGRKIQAFKEGTYFYHLSYAYNKAGVLNEQKTTGQLYVIK